MPGFSGKGMSKLAVRGYCGCAGLFCRQADLLLLQLRCSWWWFCHSRNFTLQPTSKAGESFLPSCSALRALEVLQLRQFRWVEVSFLGPVFIGCWCRFIVNSSRRGNPISFNSGQEGNGQDWGSEVYMHWHGINLFKHHSESEILGVIAFLGECLRYIKIAPHQLNIINSTFGI